MPQCVLCFINPYWCNPSTMTPSLSRLSNHYLSREHSAIRFGAISDFTHWTMNVPINIIWGLLIRWGYKGWPMENYDVHKLRDMDGSIFLSILKVFNVKSRAYMRKYVFISPSSYPQIQSLQRFEAVLRWFAVGWGSGFERWLSPDVLGAWDPETGRFPGWRGRSTASCSLHFPPRPRTRGWTTGRWDTWSAVAPSTLAMLAKHFGRTAGMKPTRHKRSCTSSRAYHSYKAGFR